MAYELGSGMKVFLTAFSLKVDGPIAEVVIEVEWRCAKRMGNPGSLRSPASED